MQSPRAGLDNPAIGGRVRIRDRSAVYLRRPVQARLKRSADGFIQLVPKSPGTSNKNQNKTSTALPRPALPRQARSAVLARHMVNGVPKKRIRHNKPKHRMTALVVFMAAVVFIAGSVVSYTSWQTSKQAKARVAVLSQSTEEDADNTDISEEEITSEIMDAYSVAPDLPRLIKIPRLQVTARIKRLGVKSSGELMSPSNIFDVGWYDGSSKPREGGTVLLDGHVHGPTKPGVFYRLGNLKEGDTIEVERGDGKIFTYKVVSQEPVEHDKVNMTKALSSIQPGKGGLNILTYTDRYDIRTNKYEQRLIIYAVEQ